MKIMYIITKADEIGGAQIHVKDLCQGLKAKGFAIEVIVGESGLLVDDLTRLNIKTHIIKYLVRNISPWQDILCTFEIRKKIKSFKPDVIALHSSKAGIVGRLASLFTGIPVVFTAHGWAFADGVPLLKRRLYALIEKSISPLATRIITVSKQDQMLADEMKIVSLKKQVVIHNGISDKTIVKNKSNVAKDSINLVSVARFTEQKDHITLFNALTKITDLKWELNLIGKGPLLEESKALVEKMNLSHRVNFLGEQQDVDYFLSQADIFLLVSNWEGFPISILEAMRAELPVIASDVGGINEALIDGETGYLIPRKDYLFLAECISKLISNEKLRMEMGSNARELYLKKFTIDKMIDKTIEVYQDALTIKKRYI